ncbi:MAG: rhomboid family intramembrane serine protease [Flavobacteriales bacterium]|nr:rhomboid family intramembrane serine protease [Flavobacteriales bacterium]
MKEKKIGIWVYTFWPMIFLAVCWGVWLYCTQIENIVKIGVRPREIEGLLGVLTHPFFHSTHLPDGSIDLSHIMNNSIPFLLLATALFYYYKDLSYQIFFWLFIGTGVWLWSFGRSANHIGASGIVYALFGFLTISGFIKKNKNLLGLSLATVFVYGSMIWGMFPTNPKISWEGHFSGFMIGVVLAVYFRKKGPKPSISEVSDENFINEWKYGKDYWKTEEQILKEKNNFESESSINIVYEYKSKKEKEDQEDSEKN